MDMLAPVWKLHWITNQTGVAGDSRTGPAEISELPVGKSQLFVEGENSPPFVCRDFAAANFVGLTRNSSPPVSRARLMCLFRSAFPPQKNGLPHFLKSGIRE